MINGHKRFFKVIRVGKSIPEALWDAAENMNGIPFEQIFEESVSEIKLSPGR